VAVCFGIAAGVLTPLAAGGVRQEAESTARQALAHRPVPVIDGRMGMSFTTPPYYKATVGKRYWRLQPVMAGSTVTSLVPFKNSLTLCMAHCSGTQPQRRLRK
jgi:hypothetical protein